jgi:hypothetical protein
LQYSDISTMPIELLQKIVNYIPLLVPTTEEDRNIDRWGKKIVQPPVKLNFEKREQFIKKIRESGHVS